MPSDKNLIRSIVVPEPLRRKGFAVEHTLLNQTFETILQIQGPSLSVECLVLILSEEQTRRDVKHIVGMALQLRVHLKFNEHRRKGEMSHLADIIAALRNNMCRVTGRCTTRIGDDATTIASDEIFPEGGLCAMS